MPAQVMFWRPRRPVGLAKLLAGRRVRREASKLKALCEAECPVDTGFLRDSHQIVMGPAPYGFSVVATADYGSYVHQGTARQPANPWMDRAAARLKSGG